MQLLIVIFDYLQIISTVHTDYLQILLQQNRYKNQQNKVSAPTNSKPTVKARPDAAKLAIIKARKERNKSIYDEVLQVFQKLYPRAFSAPIKPLAVGIRKELKKSMLNGFSASKIKIFLRMYCNNPKYKKLLVEGAIRVNLDGSEHSRVTKEQIPKVKKPRK